MHLVMHFITVLALLCEKEAVIITEAFVAFCNQFLDWFYPSDLAWNYQNPTVCTHGTIHSTLFYPKSEIYKAHQR